MVGKSTSALAILCTYMTIAKPLRLGHGLGPTNTAIAYVYGKASIAASTVPQPYRKR